MPKRENSQRNATHKQTDEQIQKKRRNNCDLQKKRREKIKEDKIRSPKAFIEDESKWLLSYKFIEDETRVSIVSDGRDRDETGRHYLGQMDQVCGYCGGVGFRSEIQGEFTDQKNPNGPKQIHFGDLCCCQGTVNGISDYHLPRQLEELYTSPDPSAVLFRNDARTFNNGMAMSSLTAQRGWQSRVHNNKMDAMLTSGGQLFRRIGSLHPVEGERPKCVQTYFYGGAEATKWRMQNIRKNVTSDKKSGYEIVFEQLHDILMRAENKYIQSFLGVKEYVETHLKDKVWDVKLSIHANLSPNDLIHKGRLNAPTVQEIAILMPDNDVITKNHKRYIQ